MNTDPEAIVARIEHAHRFAAHLRALAAVIENHPDLKLPYDVSIAATDAELDRWAEALRAQGQAVADNTNDHSRCVSSGIVRVTKVHDEPYRRYLAGQKFLAEHAAEVAALVAEPVSA